MSANNFSENPTAPGVIAGNGSPTNPLPPMFTSEDVPSPVPDSPDPFVQGLERLLEQKKAAESAADMASANRTGALAFGIPFFVISLALLAGYEGQIYERLHMQHAFGYKTQILILWILAAFIVFPIYYFIYHKKFMHAQEVLYKAEEFYIAMRLSTIDGRRKYFREQLFGLSSKASRVFFGDEKRFDMASSWTAEAGNILDQPQSTANLSMVESRLNSLRELVAREEREQKEERYWQYAAIMIMIIYVGGLVLAALSTIRDENKIKTLIFGVPFSVILWGAAGSLAAILYRFYTEQGRIRFAAEFRWLIARPIIGIIMGAVVYLALASGLVLLSSNGNATATPPVVAASVTQMGSFWIVAFLAGFSDKFYLGVIDLLVARTVRSEEVDSNTVLTQKERIPDSNNPADSKEQEKKQ